MRLPITKRPVLPIKNASFSTYHNHIRLYNLIFMSGRSLFFIYLIMYITIITCSIWTAIESKFTQTSKNLLYDDILHLYIINDSLKLQEYGYNSTSFLYDFYPSTNTSYIIPNIANIYFDHSSQFSPKQEYIYLYAQYKINRSLNITSDMYYLLTDQIFNYTVLLNITGYAYENNWEMKKQLGYESKTSTNQLNCDIPSPSSSHSSSYTYTCDELSIWIPYDDNGFSVSWENTILEEYVSGSMFFNTTLFFPNWDPAKYGSLTLKYIYSNSEFATAEFVLRCVLCSLTLVLLVLWIYRLQNFVNKQLVAEQRWMIVLFFACLLYQSPLTISIFASDMKSIYLLSSIFFATCVNLFIIYWSLMIDSIREIKNLLDAGVTFGLIFTCCSSVLIQRHSYTYNHYLHENHWKPLVMVVFVFGALWFLCVIGFLLWLSVSLWYASKELNKLPYLETRERQLSLRLFKHHTFLVILYVIGLSIYTVLATGNPLSLVDSRYNHLGTLIVMSVYAYIIAYVYLPSTHNLIKEKQHDFQLGFASFLCHISWQTYLTNNHSPLHSPLNSPLHSPTNSTNIICDLQTTIIREYSCTTNTSNETIIPPKWGFLNLEHYNLSLIDFIYNEKHDMQLLIAHGKLWKKFHLQKREIKDKNRVHSLLSTANTTLQSSLMVPKLLLAPRIESVNINNLFPDESDNDYESSSSDFNIYINADKINASENSFESEIDDDKSDVGLSFISPIVQNVKQRVLSLQKNLGFSSEQYGSMSDGQYFNLNENVHTLNVKNLTLFEKQQMSHTISKISHCLEENTAVLSETKKHKKHKYRKRSYNKNKKPSSISLIKSIPNFLKPSTNNIKQHLLPNEKRHVKYADIIIGFKGTDSQINFKIDVKISRTEVDPLFWYGQGLPSSLVDSSLWKKCCKPRLQSNGNGVNLNPLDLPYMKIHKGFFTAFRDCRQQLMQTILTTYYRALKQRKIPRFFITGHSLGGALAQLCGLFLEVLFGHRSVIHIYVYGCPRVGDKHFSETLSGRVFHTYRVVFSGDIMTTVPRGLGLYKHAGCEIIIDNHGNMIFNPSKAEKSLLPSRSSLRDHSLQRYIQALNFICVKQKLPHLMLNIPLKKEFVNSDEKCGILIESGINNGMEEEKEEKKSDDSIDERSDSYGRRQSYNMNDIRNTQHMFHEDDDVGNT